MDFPNFVKWFYLLPYKYVLLFHCVVSFVCSLTKVLLAQHNLGPKKFCNIWLIRYKCTNNHIQFYFFFPALDRRKVYGSLDNILYMVTCKQLIQSGIRKILIFRNQYSSLTINTSY